MEGVGKRLRINRTVLLDDWFPDGTVVIKEETILPRGVNFTRPTRHFTSWVYSNLNMNFHRKYSTLGMVGLE